MLPQHGAVCRRVAVYAKQVPRYHQDTKNIPSKIRVQVQHNDKGRIRKTRTLDVWHRASNVWHRTSVVRHRASDVLYWTSDIEHQMSDKGHRTLDVSDIEHQTSDFCNRTSDIRNRTSDIGHWKCNFRYQTSDTDIKHLTSDIEHQTCRQGSEFQRLFKAHYWNQVLFKDLSEFKDFLRQLLKFKICFSRMYEPCSHTAARAPRRACSPANVFERRTSTGKGVFALFGHDFEQILEQIVSFNVKTLSDTNLKESRHIKREKGWLLADIRRCLNSLVLPITYYFSRHNNELLVLKQWNGALNWILPLRLGTRAMCLPK